jgi:hypothetical protein
VLLVLLLLVLLCRTLGLLPWRAGGWMVFTGFDWLHSGGSDLGWAACLVLLKSKDRWTRQEGSEEHENRAAQAMTMPIAAAATLFLNIPELR